MGNSHGIQDQTHAGSVRRNVFLDWDRAVEIDYFCLSIDTLSISVCNWKSKSKCVLRNISNTEGHLVLKHDLEENTSASIVGDVGLSPSNGDGSVDLFNFTMYCLLSPHIFQCCQDTLFLLFYGIIYIFFPNTCSIYKTM